MTARLAVPLCAFWLSTILFSCSPQKKTDSSLMGTWRLLSETKIQGKDTTFSPASADQEMLKIINATHFAFLRHDLNQGKDSAAMFVAGGGTYKLDGDQYTENLDYCNFREWEKNSFHFTVTIQGDTLVQQGVEKIERLNVDRIIIEKYLRIK